MPILTQLYNRYSKLVITDLEGTFIEIENLRVAFDIDKNSSSNPNTAKIDVYNLSSHNRSFAMGADHMQLYVGYQGVEKNQPLKLLFTGNIKRVTTEKNGNDWITSFETGDGERALTEVSFNKTYSAPNLPSTKQIASEIGEAMSKTKGQIKAILDKKNIKIDEKIKLLSSVTFSGLAKNHLSQIAESTGTNFSIQDGEIHVMQPTGGIASEIFYLNEKTGLIGFPIKREIDLGKRTVGNVALSISSPNDKVENKKTKKQTKFNGIEFVSLIDANLRPNNIVFLESRIDEGKLTSGLYVIKKASYSGDTREGEWTVRCEALEVTDKETIDKASKHLRPSL